MKIKSNKNESLPAEDWLANVTTRKMAIHPANAFIVRTAMSKQSSALYE